MAVSADIIASYLAPRRVVARKLASGVREDRVLAYLMGACLLFFIAEWPGLAREAQVHPDVPLEARMSGALMALLFLVPLFAYGIAALSRLVARAFGGRGSWYGARLALFWAMLAVTPLALFQGLVAGLIGPGPQLTVVGVLVAVLFAWLWGGAIAATEGAPRPKATE